MTHRPIISPIPNVHEAAIRPLNRAVVHSLTSSSHRILILRMCIGHRPSSLSRQPCRVRTQMSRTNQPAKFNYDAAVCSYEQETETQYGDQRHIMKHLPRDCG